MTVAKIVNKYRPVPRRSKGWVLPTIGAGLVLVVVGIICWSFARGGKGSSGQQTAQASRHSQGQVAPGTGAGPIERGEAPASNDQPPTGERLAQIQAALEAGRRAMDRDDLVTAQTQLTTAVRSGATGQEAIEARAKLVKMADRAVFSPEHVKGDPHTSTYLVQKGDTLTKLAKMHKITPDLVARMNNLGNKATIREGARLKVVRGPFNAVVRKRDFTLDVFLDDVLVRTYKVGLGEHGSTPTGTWKVKNKLTNPTYFPPRGGKVIQADDPSNPLGEHWIGLEGVAGEAKNQERYGIHGTNEPDSIGKEASMGCIRMHNADVEELYSLLVIGDSQVTVVE
jgi:lipoprotein-anchoring transpeptidase ErfK/SrfK